LKERNDILQEEVKKLKDERQRGENDIIYLREQIERLERIPKKISPKSSNFQGNLNQDAGGEKFLASAISEMAENTFKKLQSINRSMVKNLPYHKDLTLNHLEQYIDVLAQRLTV
jgi:hypothetical protein